MHLFKDLLNEGIKVYDKKFWGYLVHVARSKEDRDNIFEHGFYMSKNPNILSGIYTQPLQWFSGGMFEEGEKDRIIYIETIDNPKLFDNGANRPTDTLRGFGTSEWNKIYCDTLNKLGYSIESSIMTGGKEDGEWYYKNKDVIEKFINNWDDRIKFEKIYLRWLLQQHCQIVVNGGELIIVDASCITKISKNQTTWVKYSF